MLPASRPDGSRPGSSAASVTDLPIPPRSAEQRPPVRRALRGRCPPLAQVRLHLAARSLKGSGAWYLDQVPGIWIIALVPGLLVNDQDTRHLNPCLNP